MWSNRKDQFLLIFLAECARDGEKYGKSFKGFVLDKAAKAVSDKFDELCTSTNVDFCMKTVRKRNQHIKTLRERSGWAWNEELKKLIKLKHWLLLRNRWWMFPFILVLILFRKELLQKTEMGSQQP